MESAQRPVENPELVALLSRERDTPVGEDPDRETLQAVRDGVYLVATQMVHPDGGPPVVDSSIRIGTRVNLYTTQDPTGQVALAVFTDWPALQAAATAGQDWNGLVQSGEDLFRLGLRSEYAGGVVINPAGPVASLSLRPEIIAWMYANTRHRGEPPA